ncbi:pyridoxamine 5'-phosphate oxidase family protein [Thomasclavelia cocleata]|uniref:Nitroimidazol reductase NimA, pyridoxamine 5'-phosphate oxidase superfamily n=2 Tax=Thomasclavelia cocleata TaxID=69824 RepID=A0A1I0FV61_9FIRM|nr:pyridoxamine 5'-phosphate oxidase family protein [Thomasclavelia cocleata]PJN79496.1 pyridoxamine 5'-phosphate oxidase family protein [Thomasclavelia cocleata]SET62199.1 hypothetical protein SAMN04489758_12248 [Thomasclavelia cocleata]
MRRKDRKVVESRFKEIILACYCCRLGFNDDGKIYIVPLSFGYHEENNKRIFYFHGAAEGRKIELIKKNKYVGFELDTSYKLVTSNLPCNHSAFYRSIIGNGKVSFVEDEDEKKLALRMIMEHSTGKKDWQFTDSMVSSVCVFKLEVLEISGKENL